MEHIKKMIAPVIISLIAIIYYAVYFIIIIDVIDSKLVLALIGIIPSLLIFIISVRKTHSL